MGNGAKRIIIVGGVACGPKAAARARRVDPEAEIILVDRGTYPSYAGCGLPFYVAGAIKALDGLFSTAWGVNRDPAFFRNAKNVEVRMRTSAEAVDRARKEITLRNLETGETRVERYDKLVLATGASPVVPPIEGMNLKNVFTLRRPEDAEAIVKCIEGIDAEKAVIIGGGRISLEVVDALNAQAVDSTVVEMMDQLLPGAIDPEIAKILENAIVKAGVTVYTSEKVLRLEGGGDGGVKKVVTDKREIETDFVLAAVGVKPNVELARAAGLEITGLGTVAVDEYLRTSDPDIYAGGDCVSCDSLVTGEKIYAPLGSTANKHGRVIGTNVAGGAEKFPGVAAAGIMKTMGLNLARTGITRKEAAARGIDTVSALVPGQDKSHFYPGGKDITIELTAAAADGRVLGAQVIGPGDVARRADVVTAILTLRGTVDNLANMDLCYAPPFASAMDPLLHAANVIRNKMSGVAKGMTVEEFRAAGDEIVVVDVRSPAEHAKLPFEDARAVKAPLEELRGRLADLPRDKRAVVMCKVGTRGYECQRVLDGAGFVNSAFLEGGLQTLMETGE